MQLMEHARAVKGIDDLRAEVMSFTHQCLESNISASRALAGARTMRELFDLQAQLSQQGFERFLSESSKLAGLSFKMVNEASAPIQNRAGVTVEKIFKAPAA